MDCRITSISRRPHGFTLPEFLVASGIGVLVLAAIAALWIFSSKSFAAMYNYVDLNNQSQITLDRLSQCIRRAQSVKKIDDDKLTLVDFDGVDVKWDYDDRKRTLTQTKAGEKTVLLTECDSLVFACYQRNPIGGSYDQYAVATKGTTKVVQVKWTCSRKLFGGAANTECVRSAKIVLRKV